jgi:ubiquinone/menaquinone biosynthesis C-methylase UbiE
MNSKEQFFDRWASSYERLLTTVFYQAIHKRLLEYIELPSQPMILDLGCGTGRLLHRLAAQFPSLQGIGLDFSKEMLQQARQRNQHRPRLIFVRGNAEALPFADAQFDAVLNTISFLHYPHPQQVFAEISRVLNKNGHYYLVDTIFSHLDRIPFSPGGIRFYNKQQREELGQKVRLNCLNHHHLLSNVVLSIFEKG